MPDEYSYPAGVQTLALFFLSLPLVSTHPLAVSSTTSNSLVHWMS